MKLSWWLWPAIIILSAIAVGLVSFVYPDTPVRPLIVFWFLFVCPGMAIVRLLRLREAVVEWTLAIALSFTLDSMVAAAQLYAHMWSSDVTSALLMSLAICGACVQLIIDRGTASQHSPT